MNTTLRAVALLTLVLSSGPLQAQSAQGNKNKVRPAASGNSSVRGSGTLDRITKWIGDS